MLLDHELSILHVVLAIGHELGKEAEGVHDGLFVAEVLRRFALQVLQKELQVVGQVFRDLDFARLSNVADRLDQLLICALHVVSVGAIHLQTNIFDRVL